MMFFANINTYGSETDVGFCNTNKAMVFTSRKERDTWVSQNHNNNRSIRAIPARQAHRLSPVVDWDGRREYLTVSGDQVLR